MRASCSVVYTILAEAIRAPAIGAHWALEPDSGVVVPDSVRGQAIVLIRRV